MALAAPRPKALGKSALERERFKQEVAQLSKRTGFSTRTVRGLHRHFREVRVAAEEAARTYNTNFEYTRAFAREVLCRPEGESIDDLEDLERDAEAMNFPEYVNGLAYLVRRGTAEEKVQFLFQVADADSDGEISHLELMNLLYDNCAVSGRREALYTWVKKHFKAADKDNSGTLDYQECIEILRKHPAILESISIDMEKCVATFNQHRRVIEALNADAENPEAVGEEEDDDRGSVAGSVR